MKKWLLTCIGLASCFLGAHAQSRVTINGQNRQVSAHHYNPRHAIEHRHHNGVEEGYRGFVDVNFLTGNDGVFKKINVFGGGFSTSHGYQFSPYIYLGGGLKYQYYNFDHYGSSHSVPLFADFMVNMTDSKTSPFFDFKLGYSFADIEGVYLSPSFGVRFGLHDNLAINAAIGYSLQRYDYEEDGFFFYYSDKSYAHSLSISLGIEF